MSDPRHLETTTLKPEAGARTFREARVAQPQVSLVIYHLDSTRVMRLIEGQPLVLGRDPSAEISIGDTSVSRRHARFEITQGKVSVGDLGSTNGTRLNGEFLNGVTTMSVGDEVTLGNVTVAIHVLAPLRPPRVGVWLHEQFLAALELEVERAQLFRRALAVVMIKPQRAREGGVEGWRARLRSVDRLALFGDGTLELLLPEADAAEVTRRLASLPRLECGVAIYPEDGSSAEALLEASREAMRRASAAQPVQFASAKPASVRAEVIEVSPVMRELFATVTQVADAVVPVLIRGETGTGKEVLARAIHERGPRATKPLVAINCAAIPATLVESVLFGHERGAFTGATASSAGVFEEADGGTVLLDEVGELSPAAQAALLRVLETKQVRRVGASREVKVEVRVIAATHRNLEAMVKDGSFREDLLYRLDTLTLEVPPLRERPEEIGPFAERFLAMANEANGRQVKGLEPGAMRALLRYPWPGNIRELRNAIEHAVVVAKGPLVQLGDLPRRTREFVASVLQAEEPPEPQASAPSGDLREGVQRYETQVILEALRAARGNRTEAARRLQIPVRTLSHKLRQLGIKKLGFGLDDEAGEA